jgi:hypothetical protein
MKKIGFFLLFCLPILRGGFWAQNTISLRLTPMAQTTTVNKDSFEVVLKAKLRNVSPRQKTVVWTRSYEQISNGWESAICDKNACWARRVETQPLVLAAGEESNLDVHLYPNNVNGAAIVRVRVVDQDSAANTVTGRYGFNLPVAVKETADAYPNIIIYPNPTPQYFWVKDAQNLVAEAVVFDVNGREIAHFANNGQQMPIGQLAAGSYFVGLFDAKNGLLKVVRLVKQ